MQQIKKEDFFLLKNSNHFAVLVPPEVAAKLNKKSKSVTTKSLQSKRKITELKRNLEQKHSKIKLQKVVHTSIVSKGILY